MKIDNLTLEDSSTYICNAMNEVGSSQKVFYVSVVEEPQILSNFNNITLLTNQTQQVECKIRGTPAPEVFWTFEGLRVRSGSSLVLDSSMHPGEYSCVAENSEGKTEKSFYFAAINKPSMIDNMAAVKTEVKLREGDDFELSCPFENFNTILWSFENGKIDSINHRKFDNKLVLIKVNSSANGIIHCVVSNTAGAEKFSFKITVLASPVIYPSWNLNDRVSEFLFTESDIDERTFKVGETLFLNCTAHGSPKPKVSWKKATDVISEGEILAIENLQFHHSDIYTCGADNEQGTVKKFFKIDVVSAPFIVTDLQIEKSFQMAIGDSVTLRCRIDGNPKPNIFWFKNK